MLVSMYPGSPLSTSSPIASRHLNQRGADLCQQMLAQEQMLKICSHQLDCGTTIVDCGIESEGGVQAGLWLARVCLADLAAVQLVSQDALPQPYLQVATDHPLLACMASQYAGWEVKGEQYFAMGSGPMRAAAARESLFAELNYRESPDQAIGVLEAGHLPGADVCLEIAKKCDVAPGQLTLLVAPTKSLAGSLQVVARSVETAMHKLHTLEFNLAQVQSGWGVAPLAPPASTDLVAIGRTNDAILYGARAVLYVRSTDEQIAEIGPKLPSKASKDYGRPFAEILAAHDHDFYKVDPLLFSPAVVTLVNLNSGNSFCYGELNESVIRHSFTDDQFSEN